MIWNCAFCWTEEETLRINVKSGQVLGFSEHVHFDAVLKHWNYSSQGFGSGGKNACSKQALLQIDLTSPYSTVKFVLSYRKPKLWTFHLAQSIDALGFGSVKKATTSPRRGAELQIHNRQLRIYPDENAKRGERPVKVIDNAFPRRRKTTISLELQHRVVRYTMYNSKQILDSWDIQSDTLFDFKSESRVLYVGINRVIGAPHRTGAGLCFVSLMLRKTRGDSQPLAVCRLLSYENECAVRNGNCVQICVNTVGSYRCACYPGFQLAPNKQDCSAVPQNSVHFPLLNMNECEENNGMCHHLCINTIGSYYCACRSGYTLAADGYTCLTGKVGNGGCQHNCVDTEQGTTCACHADYILSRDGRSCLVTCAVENGGCERICEDRPNGVKCLCPNGFKLNSDNTSCAGYINECQINNGGCEYQCVNLLGTFECVCPAGYMLKLDERSCQDIDECADRSMCDHVCINTPGSYQCQCREGYYLHGLYHCADINECSINNGGCQHLCTNTEGGYYCSCPPGHVLHENGRDCTSVNKCFAETDSGHSEIQAVSVRRYATVTEIDCDGTGIVSSRSGQKFKFFCSEPEPSRQCNTGDSTTRQFEISIMVPKCEVSTSLSAKLNRTAAAMLRMPDTNATCDDYMTFCHFEVQCESESSPSPSDEGSFPAILTLRGKLLSATLRHRTIEYTLKMSGDDARSSKSCMVLGNGNESCERYNRATAGRGRRWPPSMHCHPGMYLNKTLGFCMPCPHGTYQPVKNALNCLRCPGQVETTKPFSAAKSIQECNAMCKPGYISPSGITPCTPCPFGTFQAEPGRTNCVSCGRNYTTAVSASTTFADCLTEGNANSQIRTDGSNQLSYCKRYVKAINGSIYGHMVYTVSPRQDLSRFQTYGPKLTLRLLCTLRNDMRQV
ncbi:unnamed protein product [Soboliphyme baturini]|uniref:EGF-like domain-containing protein n=1 Tax=Soboliphyme baturini TaxID=241478 RepID=A0A3P8BB72_9BILA|nr:unnamed protein product [Soboliphyme baturini]